jgi:hypothetical protein
VRPGSEARAEPDRRGRGQQFAKPPFVAEYEEDRVRYNKLSEISKEADQFEESGRSSEARGKFLDLRAASVRGYFKMMAEAGLFRISENESSNS